MNRFYLITLISCFCFVSYAQETVFPGDANNNDIVDQYDLLSIGYAFGSTGPARIQQDEDQFQGIPFFWDVTFPDGTDYIYADSDGNGIVNYLDFISLFNNFGLVPSGDPLPLAIEQGVPGVNPSLIWNNEVLEVAVSNGTELNIPISIPLNDQQSINGLAFNLRYDPTYFQFENFTTEGHWLASDNQAISMVRKHHDAGLIQVATTRFGINPVSGGGAGGILNIIIIEDLIDYLELPDDTLVTKIYLEDILMLDENFDVIPVAADTFSLKLYHTALTNVLEGNLNELSANVFPNPSSASQLNLHCRYDFNDIVLIDIMGRTTTLYSGTARKQWESDGITLSPGLYSIRISGDEGISILKYLVLE